MDLLPEGLDRNLRLSDLTEDQIQAIVTHHFRRKRWGGKSKKERREFASNLGKARASSLSKARRQEIGAMGAAAREANKLRDKKKPL